MRTVRDLVVELRSIRAQAGYMEQEEAVTRGTRAWLPPDWQHPNRVELPTGHHLRPLRATDVDLHMKAVTGSQERLWSIYGTAWGWPPETLSAQQDRECLASQEADMARQESFSYALFDLGETELLGCVHLSPSSALDADADISWWVADWLLDGPIERALNSFVPAWITADWPLLRPCYLPRQPQKASSLS